MRPAWAGDKTLASILKNDLRRLKRGYRGSNNTIMRKQRMATQRRKYRDDKVTYPDIKRILSTQFH